VPRTVARRSNARHAGGGIRVPPAAPPGADRLAPDPQFAGRLFNPKAAREQQNDPGPHAYMSGNPRTRAICASRWHSLHNREMLDRFMCGRYRAGGARSRFEHDEAS
jgi:hypothetical protein